MPGVQRPMFRTPVLPKKKKIELNNLNHFVLGRPALNSTGSQGCYRVSSPPFSASTCLDDTCVQPSLIYKMPGIEPGGSCLLGQKSTI